MTEEGAFLRGQIRMEETVELDLGPATETTHSEAAQAESIASTPIVVPLLTLKKHKGFRERKRRNKQYRP